MITSKTVQDLIHRPESETPLFSVFLDLSVNSDNKRTHDVFLNRMRTHFESPTLDGHDRRAFDAVIDRVSRWVDDEFDEANQGAALYLELGGEIVRAVQLPEPVENRIEADTRPFVQPLIRLLEHESRHTVVLVDREHCRLLDIAFGRLLEEVRIEPDAYPAPHDVQAGGYSQDRFQRRKAEEARHFMKQFAGELRDFRESRPARCVVLLGTDENVSHFLDILPEATRERVCHRGHMAVDASGPEILHKVAELVRDELREQKEDVLDLLGERVQHDHYAVAGIYRTLEQLQEGKVDILVIADDVHRAGGQCTACGFYLASADGDCPYCGGDVRDGLDLGEVMVREAAAHDSTVRFVAGDELKRFDGVGALLRF